MSGRKEWSQLPIVSSSYADRVDEIYAYLALLEKITRRNSTVQYWEPSAIIKHKHRQKTVTLIPEDTHPLKASALLMIYNFMEAVSSALMQDIFDNMKKEFANQSGYTLLQIQSDLCMSILDFNNNHGKLKDALLGNLANPEDMAKALVNAWLEGSETNRKKEKSDGGAYVKWFSGNVDAFAIQKNLKFHGILCQRLDCFWETSTQNDEEEGNMKRAAALNRTKGERNLLAHGGSTFTELGKRKSLEEIQARFAQTLTFFDGLLDLVNDNLKRKRYLKIANSKTYPFSVISETQATSSLSGFVYVTTGSPLISPSSASFTPKSFSAATYSDNSLKSVSMYWTPN